MYPCRPKPLDAAKFLAALAAALTATPACPPLTSVAVAVAAAAVACRASGWHAIVTAASVAQAWPRVAMDRAPPRPARPRDRSDTRSARGWSRSRSPRDRRHRSRSPRDRWYRSRSPRGRRPRDRARSPRRRSRSRSWSRDRRPEPRHDRVWRPLHPSTADVGAGPPPPGHQWHPPPPPPQPWMPAPANEFDGDLFRVRLARKRRSDMRLDLAVEIVPPSMVQASVCLCHVLPSNALRSTTSSMMLGRAGLARLAAVGPSLADAAAAGREAGAVLGTTSAARGRGGVARQTARVARRADGSWAIMLSLQQLRPGARPVPGHDGAWERHRRRRFWLTPDEMRVAAAWAPQALQAYEKAVASGVRPSMEHSYVRCGG